MSHFIFSSFFVVLRQVYKKTLIQFVKLKNNDINRKGYNRKKNIVRKISELS